MAHLIFAMLLHSKNPLKPKFQRIRSRSKEIFILNCTVKNCDLRDHIAQAVRAYHIFKCIISGVKAAFRLGAIPNINCDLIICPISNNAITNAVPFDFYFSTTFHTPLEIADRFKTVIFNEFWDFKI